MRTTTIALIGLASVTGLASAQYQVFRGHDNNIANEVPMASTPESGNAYQQFYTAVKGKTVATDFETFTAGSRPDTLNIAPKLSAAFALAADGHVENRTRGGAHAILGTNYALARVAEGEAAFTLTFERGIRNFGFFHTDVANWYGWGENPGSFIVRIGSGENAVEFDLITSAQSQDIRRGSVGFFGIASDTRFTEISLIRPVGGGSTDLIGFDAFVIPTPSSIALLGLGGLAVARRRR